MKSLELTNIEKLALLEMYRSKHYNDMDWEDETNDDLHYKVCDKISELEDMIEMNYMERDKLIEEKMESLVINMCL